MSPSKSLVALVTFTLIATFCIGQSLLTCVPIGNHPQALAVNAFTNRIYVLEESANQVTEIDGLTNAAVTIPPGTNRQASLNGALAINPIANTLGNIGAGANIVAVDVLPNRVYITTAYLTGSSVTVLSGASGTFAANLLDELMGPVNGSH